MLQLIRFELMGHASAEPPARRFVRVYDPDAAGGRNPENASQARLRRVNSTADQLGYRLVPKSPLPDAVSNAS